MCKSHKIHFLMMSTQVFLLLVSGCKLPDSDLDSPHKYGSIGIFIESESYSRTLDPGIVLEVLNYDIVGDGPGESEFNVTDYDESSYSRTDLMAGSWTITVTGKNSAGIPIVVDSKTITIIVDDLTLIEFKCIPFTGTGNLSLNLTWPIETVEEPKIIASLTPVSGTASNLDFNISNASASYPSTPFTNGYYTLSLSLYNQVSNSLAWSWVETVLIISGKTTTGGWTLTTNEIGIVHSGGINIQISTDTQEPILTSLSGVVSNLRFGSIITITATGTPIPDLWQWYLDGIALPNATTDSLTFGSDLSVGMHSIVAVAKLGDVAGSKGFRFRVVESAVPRNGLIAEWLFENNLSDTSGHGDTLTSLSLGNPVSAKFTPDRFGNPNEASLLDILTYLKSTNNVMASPVYSFSFWTYAYSYNHSLNPYIIAPAGNDYYSIYAHNTDGDGIGKSLWCKTATKPAIGKWTHFVINIDSSSNTSSIYQDGILNVHGKAPQSFNEASNWLIGRHSLYEQDHWNGSIDDIRIYNRTLNNAEIASLYTENNWQVDLNTLQISIIEPTENAFVSKTIHVAGTVLQGNEDIPLLVALTGDDTIFRSIPAVITGDAWTADIDSIITNTENQHVPDGSYVISLKVGNITKARSYINIDNMAPTVLVSAPQAAETDRFNTRIVFCGTVYDPYPVQSIVAAIYNSSGVEIGRSSPVKNINWTIVIASSSISLGDGQYTYMIFATDKAGNTNSYLYHIEDMNTLFSRSIGEADIGPTDQNEPGASLPLGITTNALFARRRYPPNSNPALTRRARFYIDMSTDKPTFSLSIPSESLAMADNIVPSGSNVIGQVMDDDGIDKFSMSAVFTPTTADGTPLATGIIAFPVSIRDTTLNKTAYTLNIPMRNGGVSDGSPIPNGMYQLVLTARDINNVSASSNPIRFIIGGV